MNANIIIKNWNDSVRYFILNYILLKLYFSIIMVIYMVVCNTFNIKWSSKNNSLGHFLKSIPKPCISTVNRAYRNKTHTVHFRTAETRLPLNTSEPHKQWSQWILFAPGGFEYGINQNGHQTDSYIILN